MKTKITFIVIIISFVFRNQQGYAQHTITADSIIQTSPCAGSNIYIPYTVTGGNFHIGNVFTAQLSNSTGSFSNPTNIGSIPYWGNGLIIGTIPLTATLGINYKVRIISSSPTDTSTESPNTVIVIHIAQIATITVSPLNGTICSGDSATLSDITPAQNYLWSTGATTQSIEVKQSGSFTVTVTDVLGCKTTSSPPTVVTVQPPPIAMVTVFPTNGTICSGDSAMISDTISAHSYLWSNGKTTQSIEVNQSGAYTVTVTDLAGCKGTSSPITITVQECASVQSISSSDVMDIYPNPFCESLTLQINSATAGTNYKFGIYNLMGQEVMKSMVNQQKTVIQRGNLSSGIFFYKIESNEGIIQTGKIIIQ